MIQAPIVSASAASTEPLATSPGAAKAQPKGVSPRILAAALMCSTKPETSSPMSLEIRLGSCVTARTARKAMIAVVSRPRRDEEIPAAVTTIRERMTQVARAAGAHSNARNAARVCPATNQVRAGMRQMTAVRQPGMPRAPAASSPTASPRDGAVQAAMARGSRVESTPVTSRGTTAQPATSSAPREPSTSAVTWGSELSPRPTAPASTMPSTPSPYRAPITVPTMAQTFLLRALRVRRHFSLMRVSTTTAPPSVPGPPPAR